MDTVNPPPKKRPPPPNAGKGRPKGAVNKVTTEFRETVRDLLDKNQRNVAKWLALVADGTQRELEDGTTVGREGDPGRALDLMAKLAEYAAPKLARTEHVGPNNGPIQVAAIDTSKLTPDQLRALSEIQLPDDE